MQRIDPRPDPPNAEGQQQQSGVGNGSNKSTSWTLPTGFASTGRESHTQSFEEIYGAPENFLEIEVCPKPIHGLRRIS
jgi:sorting nexin-3/12